MSESIGAADLGGAPEEVQYVRDGQVEAERVEYDALHVNDVLAGEGAVADVDKIHYAEFVNLLHLGGDQESSEADQLKLRAGDRLLHIGATSKESVENVDGEEEGVGGQTEVDVHLDQPIDQHGSVVASR
jgi:hypothetical protein